MTAIGPYVVIREVSPTPGTPVRSDEGGGVSRTLLVTDRVTGMPALLHGLCRPRPAPQLPRSPSLLPFVDLVRSGDDTYLVTELPPQVTAANDPVLAARGALSALNVLHMSGLAHGAIDAGQLWSVDGRVMLAGGGLTPLGPDYTAARDLRDLAVALDQIGGLPGILGLLRDPPTDLSAQDARKLLEAGARDEMSASAPSLSPASLFGSGTLLPQQGSYVRQSSLDESGPSPAAALRPPSAVTVYPAAPAPPGTDLGAGTLDAENIADFKLNIDEWDFPVSLKERLQEEGQYAAAAPNHSTRTAATFPTGAGVTTVAEASAVPLSPPTSPESAPTAAETRKRGVASRARDRLRADTARLKTLAEARRDLAPGQWAEVVGSAGVPTESPQERRRREQQAMQAQAKLDVQNAADRQSTATSARQSSVGGEPLPAGERRTLKPIRATWSADQTWHVVREDGATPSFAPPRWLWPVLGGLAAALLLTALVHNRRQPSAAPCCTVQFILKGANAQNKTAHLTVETAPAAARLQPGQSVGQAPGTVHLAVPGQYRLRVSTDGFTPASLKVSVPTSQPVTINLGP
ncbi:PEGA domain-containing protein [Deinococcus sp.]|uniref:PEGA domain-containing protein n=1 Tax=Deinococcus sp. TaxID=47478 RepID=UPI0025BE03CE|nr:PEGA domain-containing protein [Deinococcus sp.]